MTTKNRLSLEQQAAKALKAGKMIRTPCKSKQEVLHLICCDRADAMSVIPPSFHMGEFEAGMSHYAIRFEDRVLGEQVRQHSIRGFGLTQKREKTR